MIYLEPILLRKTGLNLILILSSLSYFSRQRINNFK
jgi:hypothetical protein